MLQTVWRNKLENVKLARYADFIIFYDEFERSFNDKKKSKCSKRYSYIGALINVLPGKDRTVEYLKSKIRMKKTQSVDEEMPGKPRSRTRTLWSIPRS